MREKVRGECRFSSLMKQNKKGNFYFIIYIAGFFFKFFLCYEVFAKQKKNYSPHYATYGSYRHTTHTYTQVYTPRIYFTGGACDLVSAWCDDVVVGRRRGSSSLERVMKSGVFEGGGPENR